MGQILLRLKPLWGALRLEKEPQKTPTTGENTAILHREGRPWRRTDPSLSSPKTTSYDRSGALMISNTNNRAPVPYKIEASPLGHGGYCHNYSAQPSRNFHSRRDSGFPEKNLKIKLAICVQQ